ncbi:hypothetical protein C8J57DRAFT_1503651 [Mycena rebaudengoi]|nr:hypothetical protein C8J57DRAFT_1503651 [Mycena rebaudengoi]
MDLDVAYLTLIVEDLDITLSNAFEERDASYNFERLFHPQDDGDEILDDLHNLNIQAMKGKNNAFFSQPPCFNRLPPQQSAKPKSNKKLSDTDFVEPTSKSKKLIKDSKKENNGVEAKASVTLYATSSHPSFTTSFPSFTATKSTHPSSPSARASGWAFCAVHFTPLPPCRAELAPEIVAMQHSVHLLDGKTLAGLAKRFADSIPDRESGSQHCRATSFCIAHHFSFACHAIPLDYYRADNMLRVDLLKNKSRSEAATEAPEWVVSKQEMRECPRKEKEVKETRENIERKKLQKVAQEPKTIVSTETTFSISCPNWYVLSPLSGTKF